MSVSFGGIGEMTVTFAAAEDVVSGSPVKVSGSGEVSACAADERFCGVALYVSEDDYATVQMGGYVEMEFTGEAPKLGFTRLVAAEGGKVAADTAAKGGEYLVIDVDKTASTVGFIM